MGVCACHMGKCSGFLNLEGHIPLGRTDAALRSSPFGMLENTPRIRNKRSQAIDDRQSRLQLEGGKMLDGQA